MSNFKHSWQITWGDHTFTDLDITGEHTAVLALLTGVDSWEHLDLSEMGPEIGPARLMWLITAWVAVAREAAEAEDFAEIIKDVRETSVVELLNGLTFRE